MTLSAKQIRIAGMAARSAGWDDGRRYLALRHAGCPETATGQPSARNGRNTQRSFEIYMALAETSALIEGDRIPGPRAGGTWRDAASRASSRMTRMIRNIESECIERLPYVFHRGFLPGFIARMTSSDEEEFSCLGASPVTVDDLDGGQAHRVLEGLKAWTLRELRRRGLRPRSFRESSGTVVPPVSSPTSPAAPTSPAGSRA